MKHVYVGDEKTVIRHMFKEELPSGSQVKMLVKKPDGTVDELPAEIKPGAGIYANFVEAVNPIFDQLGIWHFQVYIESPDWKGRADARQVEVLEPFV